MLELKRYPISQSGTYPVDPLVEHVAYRGHLTHLDRRHHWRRRRLINGEELQRLRQIRVQRSRSHPRRIPITTSVRSGALEAARLIEDELHDPQGLAGMGVVADGELVDVVGAAQQGLDVGDLGGAGRARRVGLDRALLEQVELQAQHHRAQQEVVRVERAHEPPRAAERARALAGFVDGAVVPEELHRRVHADLAGLFEAWV